MGSFQVDLGELAALGSIDRTVFPRLHLAVQHYANLAHAQWVEEIRRAEGVWVGDKQRYESSLQMRMLGDFVAEVFTDLKLAEEIERGRPQRDLKRMLDTSLKVRVNKKGQRYLIIPFRHNTPGHTAWANAMPGHIYQAAKQLAPSFIAGLGQRPTGQGSPSPFLSDVKTQGPMMTPSHAYQWGGRLPAGLAPKLKAGHASDPFAGMVRMNTSAGKGATSAYLTFRVMREGQAGKWLIAPRPGLHLADTVQSYIDRLDESAFQVAVQMDFEDALKQAE